MRVSPTTTGNGGDADSPRSRWPHATTRIKSQMFLGASPRRSSRSARQEHVSGRSSSPFVDAGSMSVGTVAHRMGPPQRQSGLHETERARGLRVGGEGPHRSAVPLRAVRPTLHVPARHDSSDDTVADGHQGERPRDATHVADLPRWHVVHQRRGVRPCVSGIGVRVVVGFRFQVDAATSDREEGGEDAPEDSVDVALARCPRLSSPTAHRGGPGPGGRRPSAWFLVLVWGQLGQNSQAMCTMKSRMS